MDVDKSTATTIFERRVIEMIDFNVIRDNLTDEQIDSAVATGIMCVQTTIIDLQKGFGSAPISTHSRRLSVVDEMWDTARFWSMRANEEYLKDNAYQTFVFLRARLYMRLAIMVMRETGEWWDFPHN